jgi:hypothetical protein
MIITLISHDQMLHNIHTQECQFIVYILLCNLCIPCVISLSMYVFILIPTHFTTYFLFYASMWFPIYNLHFFAVLVFELRAPNLLGKCSTT